MCEPTSIMHSSDTYVNNAIENLKRTCINPYVVVGGDLNRLKLDAIAERFHDLELCNIGGTRGCAQLDKIATNIPHIKSSVQQPLENDYGTRKSDHAVVLL